MLRQWPASGKWVVQPFRDKNSKLGCLLLTAYERAGESHDWGFVRFDHGISMVIGDRNEFALAGNDIRLIIDGIVIGNYTVSKRHQGAAMSSLAADVNEHDRQKILHLLQIGGTVKFQTEASTYSAPLEGMAAALWHMQQCEEEANQMDANHQ